jgi:uncharacterized protein (DUF849 family)
MPNPFIIMSAPNGARRQKTDHPAIPITPSEMALCAEQIIDGGASILHLHVRDDQGAHSLDVDRYRASIKAIKDAVGANIIIQSTTEAVGIYNREQQMDMVRTLIPEAASLALRELCPSDNEMVEFSEFLSWVKSENIFPQFILYNEDDFNRFERYQKAGLFQSDNPFVLLVFGSYQDNSQGAKLTAKKLWDTARSAAIPWAACGFADNERECVTRAAKLNAHIRVGFENNIWDETGSLLENNTQMINFAAEQAQIHDRPVATAADVKNIFNLRN